MRDCKLVICAIQVTNPPPNPFIYNQLIVTAALIDWRSSLATKQREYPTYHEFQLDV
jgi:hypothetical protein